MGIRPFDARLGHAGSVHLFLAMLIALFCLGEPASAQVTATTPVFGPATYTRTTGNPNQYTTTFTAPAWIVSPYTLHIVNGKSDGSNRVSSATITLNGTQAVAAPSDFDQNVATIDRTVTIQASDTLQLTLASKPGSYLTINVVGTNADHTSPQLTISPANSSYINSTTPSLEITYADPVGSGEPAASGIDTSTFQATLDGVDQTNLFTVRTGDASATIPSSLALSNGAHSLVVSIKDKAGNEATSSSQFTVDLSTPQIQIMQPVLGSYLNQATQPVTVQYSDPFGVNVSTLKILVNGSDQTAQFTKTNSSATATLSLAQGANQISAQIQNLAGTPGLASTSFDIDTTPPTISFSHPVANSYHGSSTVDVQVEFSDNEALNASTLSITLDGVALSPSSLPTSATATATSVATGAHTLIASIKDMAGNVGTSTIVFYVDTTTPTIHVTPANGAIVATHGPVIVVDYSDVEGVDTSSLKVVINGVDATSQFAITPTQATATLSGGSALVDGQSTISAQISNLAGTSGAAVSQFLVDTTPPSLTIQSPPSITNSNSPTVSIRYSDAGAGVDPASLVVTLDGADVSSLIAAGSTSATGALQLNPALSDGAHQLTATVADHAGNRSVPVTLSFVIDTKPPILSFTSPVANAFINNPTPALALQYADSNGTGVDTSSLSVNLQSQGNPATDVTADFQIGPQQASGAIPTGSPLADGTYVLTATAKDQAGNLGTATSTFVVDTVPPTATIQSPTVNAIFNTGAVSLSINYQDDRSGVDTSKVTLTVDGVDQTSLLTLDGTSGTGTLSGLVDGVHTAVLTVYDRAGNSSGAISQQFTTDTTPPTIAVSLSPAPNAAGWNNSPVTVTFVCADTGSGIATCPTPISVSMDGAGQSFCGQATDAAGNASLPACATVNLDQAPPAITATVTPAPLNGIYYLTATITFTCSDSLSGVANCPSPITDTTIGPGQVISGTATDAAGNTASTSVTLDIERPNPPVILPVVSPQPNANGWNNSDVTVSFTCTPGTYSVASCQPPVVVSTEGGGQSVCGTATDTTGLSSNACVTVNLDKTPPTITAQINPAPSSSGWNTGPVTVSFTCSDSGSGIVNCPGPQTLSTSGANQSVSGTATDLAGNHADATVSVSIDLTPPTIVQFSAPSQAAPGQAVNVTLAATDAIEVSSVIFELNGTAVATLNAPPFEPVVTIPANANPGDTLTLTAVVTNIAGVAASSSRGIQVVAAGVVTGQVLSDASGLPLAGAAVQVSGGNGQDTSDATGRYSIPLNSSHVYLSINAASGSPAMVGVEREVFLQQGVGTVPVDARLTPVAAATAIDATGGTVTSGSLSVSVAPGVVAGATNFYLTPLSQQGLPELLPLGWSPAAAFDLRSDNLVIGSFSATFASLPSSVSLHLVQYDYPSHSWLMVTPNLVANNGALTVQLPSMGDFALVAPDAGNTAISVANAGQPLTGVPVVELPSTSTASGFLNPPSLAPSGGTSTATLALKSALPLPSGTVIQANVSETYALLSGAKLSSANRVEDIVLYQYAAPAGAAAVANFPVTPSQTFQAEGFASGNVHLDILSGREAVRGQVGGSSAVAVTGGDATLTVSSGSLAQNTAVSVMPDAVEGFLPSSGLLVPLAEYTVDFSGESLTTPAALSVAAGTAQPGDNILLAQVQRIAGVPYLVVVSAAQVIGANLTTQALPGLPGITQGGDYVFYKVTSPTGYISGTVTASGSPIVSLVQTDGLPFVAFSGSSGSYMLPALAGSVTVSASVANTALASSTLVQVNAGQTVTANLSLSGQVEAATITPANGAVGVPLTAEIDITVTDPINQTTVTASSVTLMQSGQGSSTPVPVRFVFSQGGTRLAVFPTSALQPSSSYTLTANGLATSVGALITVPSVTFTTQSLMAPNFNTSALVFSMPDQNGNVQVSAPANSFPPGSTVLIVDQTNGVVLSLTVGNDGSVTGQMPATIDDVLAVTITAPDKTTASFTISQFVAPDGTTAVGPGGGSVTGPGNLAMIIPQGALPKGTTFKLDLLDQSAFSELPNWPNLQFGSGMQITAPAMPSFNKEVKLAFPVPANAPSGAFFYVFRLLTDQNNNVLFETIDHAFVQGTGANTQVVTASPPFCGYMNSYGNFQADASGSFSPLLTAIVKTFVMWTFDPNQPGVASSGLIEGKIFVSGPPAPGQTSPSFVTLQGPVSISLTNNSKYTTTSDPKCGTYALFDPQFGGGSRSVTAKYNVTGQTILATANEVNGIQVNDADYDVTAGLEMQYKNIGRLNFTFNSPTPPPPPPQINIGVYTLDSTNQRQPIQGIVQSGVNLVITFATNSTLSVTGATINGTTLAVQPDPSGGSDGLNHYVVTDQYSSAAPGLYTIVANALNSLNPASPITETKNFLVVAAGGSNSSTTQGVAPTVINSIPLQNSKGVPVSTFPNVVFSEPVTNVPANLTFVDAEGNNPSIDLVGVRADGTVVDPVGASDAITSLTIQPVAGLSYNEQYTLTLKSGIVDQNTPPLPLSTFTLSFTTVDPDELGSTPPADTFTSTRGVVIGDRVYLGEFYTPTLGALGIVDISNPSSPLDKGAPVTFVGRPMDIAGLAASPVARCVSPQLTAGCFPVPNGPLIAVAAGQAASETITPSNIYLYDVSVPDQPVRVGAVSATTSTAQDGLVLRLFMKDQLLYTSTFLKGLEVIDLGQVVSEYQSQYGANPSEVGQALTTEGSGFAMDSIVNTIPLYTNNHSATMWDVKAGDFPTGTPNPTNPNVAMTQNLVVATGLLPLVVADPQQSAQNAVLYPLSDGTTVSPQNPGAGLPNLSSTPLVSSDGRFQLQLGKAIALGTVAMAQSSGNSTPEQIAVIVGTGVAPALPDGTPASGVLAVVNMNDPKNPVPQGFVGLRSLPIDLVLRGSLAIIGTTDNKALLVNVTDPAQPIDAGEIDPDANSALGERLTVTDSGLIISSSASGTKPGIQITGLGTSCAYFREQIQKGIHRDNVTFPLNDLDWTINTGTLTALDGFELDGVKLGDRLMANKMTLPYFILTRNSTDASPAFLQCNLNSGGVAPCVRADGSAVGRSQLLEYRYLPSTTPSNRGNYFFLQASYFIDNLDRKDDSEFSKPDSCVVMTQRYEFWREGYDAPEASDELSAARFKPEVSYKYFTNTGPSIISLNAAQRFQFAPTAFAFNSSTTPATFSYDPSPNQVATFFLDCEKQDITSHGGCESFFTDIRHLGTTTPNGNPVPYEIINHVVIGGQAPPTETRTDNLHLRAFFDNSGAPGSAIEGPTIAGHPGCPECVHIHWRWGSNLTRDQLPGVAVVSPRFDNNGGRPIIPLPSTQDIDVGLLVSDIKGGAGTEAHPVYPNTYSTYLTGKAINSGEPLSLWYSATGHSNQDSFMIHGGFFSSLRATISNPYTISSNLSPVLPLQISVTCLPILQKNGTCPIYADIQNRTGHPMNWKATITDQNTGAIVATSTSQNPISGVPGAEVPGTATIYVPIGMPLQSSYILDVTITDTVTGWSTERQAYVTVSGVSALDFLPGI